MKLYELSPLQFTHIISCTHLEGIATGGEYAVRFITINPEFLNAADLLYIILEDDEIVYVGSTYKTFKGRWLYSSAKNPYIYHHTSKSIATALANGHRVDVWVIEQATLRRQLGYDGIEWIQCVGAEMVLIRRCKPSWNKLHNKR